MKIIAALSIICALGLTLTACTHGYNPQTTSMSSTDQCITLQRQMLFAGSTPYNTNPNDGRWTTQVKTQQMNKQFDNMDCYQKLEDARNDQPQK